jgi:hypothetical protein
MIDTWKDKSQAGTVHVRTQLVSELQSPQKLAQVIERVVRFLFPTFIVMVERLLGLIKGKGALLEDFKQILLSTPPEGVWRALDSLYALTNAMLIAAW